MIPSVKLPWVGINPSFISLDSSTGRKCWRTPDVPSLNGESSLKELAAWLIPRGTYWKACLSVSKFDNDDLTKNCIFSRHVLQDPEPEEEEEKDKDKKKKDKDKEKDGKDKDKDKKDEKKK